MAATAVAVMVGGSWAVVREAAARARVAAALEEGAVRDWEVEEATALATEVAVVLAVVQAGVVRVEVPAAAQVGDWEAVVTVL